FLSDLFVRCAECEGKRFQPHVLRVHLYGKSIHDVLQLTVTEAIQFFAQIGESEKLGNPLDVLDEVGLGYLRLGQPLNTLSGGESQRLKLVRHLADQGAGTKQNGSACGNLLIFDEPTTGLHFDDVAMLVKLFQRLVEAGNSLIVIEHNLEVIKCADWVIDLGPEGGEAGGRLVAAGPPETIARAPESHTARFLAEALRGPAQIADAPPAYASAVVAANGNIRLVGAREHNLRDLSLELPRDRLIVLTGLSGSGKSSLAFDVLHAEGQRRYVDSLSAYARQLLNVMAKPDIDLLAGLPPTVAIEQRLSRGGRTSTVATATEIYHYLRLLFAKLGVQHCTGCGQAIRSQTRTQILTRLRRELRGQRVTLLAPVVRGRKGYHKEELAAARKLRLREARIDGRRLALERVPLLDRYREH